MSDPTPVPTAFGPNGPEHERELLAALLDDTDQLSEAQLAHVWHQLQTSAADRQWLREQRRMDELLARELDPTRADFPNRVRAVRQRATSSQFLRRVTRAVAVASPRSAPRQASRSLRRPSRVPLGLAAALAAGAMLLTAWILALTPAPVHAPQVVMGEVDAEGTRVQELPTETRLTVGGSRPAVITLGTSGHAELAPASQVELSGSDRGCRLVSGSGEFSLDASAPLKAGAAQVEGAGAQVGAAWVPSDRHGAAPGERALRLTVAAGEAHVRLPHQAVPQVLHPHEVLVVEMDRASGAAVRTRRILVGHIWAVARQAQGLAITIGDVHSQRTCLVTSATTITVEAADGAHPRQGTADELRRGAAVEATVGSADRSATPVALVVRVERSAP